LADILEIVYKGTRPMVRTRALNIGETVVS
jgi:hypothetical protein